MNTLKNIRPKKLNIIGANQSVRHRSSAISASLAAVFSLSAASTGSQSAGGSQAPPPKTRKQPKAYIIATILPLAPSNQRGTVSLIIFTAAIQTIVTKIEFKNLPKAIEYTSSTCINIPDNIDKARKLQKVLLLPPRNADPPTNAPTSLPTCAAVLMKVLLALSSS